MSFVRIQTPSQMLKLVVWEPFGFMLGGDEKESGSYWLR